MKADQAKAVSDEIAAAFHDVPLPARYVQEDFEGYDDGEDVGYYIGKTWFDIANDLEHLAGYIPISFMTKECLLYFFPGYLIGSARHKFVFVEPVITALLGILSARKTEQEEFAYLLLKFTPAQKNAVAHWLELQLELDKERHPDLYEGNRPTLQRLAFNRWREWA
jgi:hypothetical protein